MLYLYRYAKHLGCQQRLEITKEDKNNDNEERAASGFVEERIKEDVHIKDYLPALKSICDKLEEADGKVIHTQIPANLFVFRVPVYQSYIFTTPPFFF